MSTSVAYFWGGPLANKKCVADGRSFYYVAIMEKWPFKVNATIDTKPSFKRGLYRRNRFGSYEYMGVID